MNEENGGGGGEDKLLVRVLGPDNGLCPPHPAHTKALISASHAFLLYVTASACTATGRLIGRA